MKFVTFEENGEIKSGILSDQTAISFAEMGLGYENLLDFIKNHTPKDMEILAKFEAKNLAKNLDKISLKAPIIRPESDIICLGINYMEHAKESYKFKNKEFDGKRENAVYFSKHAYEIVGTNTAINGHFELTNSLDYEAELAIIIGKNAKNVSIENAKDYIFGYTIFNDISARDLQNRHKQWFFGKSLDNFSIMGPVIDTTLDSSDLAIRSFVNGELRQNSRTSAMIFDENYVIAELSKGITLKAGTIISLGTPSGVGMGFVPPKFLKSGDEIICEIENLGRLVNTIK